jgi:ActR/RegA family two-component response regulator/GAF domain-containing protein
MCRVLILDDEPSSAQFVKLVIESNSDNKAESFTTVKEATGRVIASVQEGKPFEAFLIDLQLADGENGIEVMKDLRKISPDTETIIFTGYGDSANGLSAYKAGAFRYLAKPYENEELLYLIDALREWRKTRMEHGWQKQFTRVMEVAMQQDNFHDTAKIIVSHSLKLGFKRAHLFWVPSQQDANKENLFIGIACDGKGIIPQFEGGLFPVMDWFDLRKASRENNAITLRELRTDRAVEAAEMYDFRLPPLEASILPIRRGKKLAGYLLLDFDQEKRTLSEHERSLLNLFARQVSVVLNRASLHAGEQLLLQESSIIQAIGGHITTKAASVSLNDLLEEIRRQIGALMDVSNFSVFLLNEETNELNFHLLYEKGKRHQGVIRTLGNGIEEYLLTSQKELLLSQPELHRFVQNRGIAVTEDPPFSLLGVPLRVAEKTIGGIIASQYSTQASEYFERDKRILLSVANQVAGRSRSAALQKLKGRKPAACRSCKGPARKCSALCRKTRMISG